MTFETVLEGTRQAAGYILTLLLFAAIGWLGWTHAERPEATCAETAAVIGRPTRFIQKVCYVECPNGERVLLVHWHGCGFAPRSGQ
jgi:hypothetical protein